MSNWFNELTGFDEVATAIVAERFDVDGEYLISRANGRRMRHGRFETPSLAELRSRLGDGAGGSGHLTVREVVGEVMALHRDRSNAGALFQVASQFNTLEMVGPHVTPESGITQYEDDHTQGPACAVSCGAGLIYRNYLVPVQGRRGQTASRQINLLSEVIEVLGVDIPVRNGYALPSDEQLTSIDRRLAAMDDADRDLVRARFAVGMHSDTEVTLGGAGHTVSQAYCSAMPVAYSPADPTRWEPLARLVLEAAYEAILAAGALNARATGNRTVYLTMLGGGAFGNPERWILDAARRALNLFAERDLDVAFVSYGSPNPGVAPLLR